MKKLNLISLEEQQLNEKQLNDITGGVNWCDCDVSSMGPNDSVSTWHATPDPSTGGGSGNPGGGVNWCDCDVSEVGWSNSVSTWHATPYPR